MKCIAVCLFLGFAIQASCGEQEILTFDNLFPPSLLSEVNSILVRVKNFLSSEASTLSFENVKSHLLKSSSNLHSVIEELVFSGGRLKSEDLLPSIENLESLLYYLDRLEILDEELAKILLDSQLMLKSYCAAFSR